MVKQRFELLLHVLCGLAPPTVVWPRPLWYGSALQRGNFNARPRRPLRSDGQRPDFSCTPLSAALTSLCPSEEGKIQPENLSNH